MCYTKSHKVACLAKNDINFLNDAVVRNCIRLVQAETLTCVDEIRPKGYAGIQPRSFAR